MNAAHTKHQVTQAKEQLSGFLHWWADGLKKGLPPAARRLFIAEKKRLILDIAETEARARLSHGETDSFLGNVTAQRPLDDQLPKLEMANADVIMELPSDRILRRRQEWPMEALHGFEAALDYQLDRLLPVDPESVQVAHKVLSRDRSKGTFTFEIAAVPKEDCDIWIRALENSRLSEAKTGFRVKGDEKEYRFGMAGRNGGRRSRSRNRWILMISLILVAAALYLPLEAKRRTLALLDDQIAQIKGGAEIIRVHLNEQNQRRAAIESIVADRFESWSRSEVLNELTVVLPDSAYLKSIVLNGNQLDVTGEADSATEVVEAIEVSEFFRSVEFSTAVRRNRKTGKEQFSLKIWVRRSEKADDVV